MKVSAVQTGSGLTWFQVKSGLKQGCNMSGFLFLTIVDWINTDIRWKCTSKLEDLGFTDDIAFLSSTKTTDTK